VRYDDPFPPHVRQAIEGAERIHKLLESSGIGRLAEEVTKTQRLYEAAFGGLSNKTLIDATGAGVLARLAGDGGFAAKILGERAALKLAIGEDVAAALRPVFPEWLNSTKLVEAARVAGIGSDIALAARQYASLSESIAERFAASNAVLLGLDEPRLAVAARVAASEGAISTIRSTIGAFAARDAELWRNVSGYHIASQLAVARIEEAFAAQEHLASLATLKNLNAFTSAYDRLVGDLAAPAALPNALLPQLPAELFAHTALIDLFRPEPDLEETEEARQGFIDETRVAFRTLVADQYPALFEHVRAADEARRSRGPGWAATFCLALRRLIEHAYEIVAPIAQVRAWPLIASVASGGSQELRARLLQPSGTPTTFARILFATNALDPGADVSLPTFVGTDFDGVRVTFALLNRHIHGFTAPVDQAALDLAQARAERYTMFILLLRSQES
jgi:hypothetical protein